LNLESIKQKLRGNYGRIGLLLFIILLLAIILPYRPPLSWSISGTNDRTFSENFGDFLQITFELGGVESLKSKLLLQHIDYKISKQRANITLFDKNSNRVRKLLLSTNKPEKKAEDLKYCWIQFSGEFSSEEKTLITAKLKDTDKFFKVQKKNVWRLFSDLYAHLVMVLLALSLIFLFTRKWGKVFTVDDLLLIPIVLIGLVNIFIFTDYAIGDIKLHFYNELTDTYKWSVYGPGNIAFQKMIYRLFYTSDVVLFNINRLFAIFCAIPLYIIIKRRFGGKTMALASAFLLVTHPTWLRYGASDLTHPWAIFLFLSAVSLIVAEHKPDARKIFFAFILLALSMLGRGEFVLFFVAALLLVGFDKIAIILKSKPRAVFWGFFVSLLMVLPQVITLDTLMALEEDQFLHFDWLASFSTWFWLGSFADGYNTFADLKYSPWVYLAFSVFGFLMLLKDSPKKTLALFLCPMLFLWNPYFFVRVFSSTHYQLPALPFYIIFTAYGFGTVVRYLQKQSSLPSFLIAIISLGAVIWYLSIYHYSSFLKGDYTYMNQYRTLVAHKEHVDPECVLLFTRPQGDLDLHNPQQVWFASDRRFKSYVDLPFSEVPDINKQCLYYLKTPACNVADNEDEKRNDGYKNQCEAFQAGYKLEPVWESTIKAKEAVGEQYFNEDIPVGLYRLGPR